MPKESKTLLERIPGTKAHAEQRITELFNNDQFDPDKLSHQEATVLQESIDEKYVPALIQSYRDRYRGFIDGLLGTEALLIILTVVLSGSAGATTGAWYSISLKEMKEKFENMGLTLTSKLLTSDMSANSLALSTGAGYMLNLTSRPVIEWLSQNVNLVQEVTSNSTAMNIIKFTTSALIAGITIPRLFEILKNKESASIQFDFNDATLAGMTEEQQKFFSKSINEVYQALEKLNEKDSDILIGRRVFSISKSLLKSTSLLDISNDYGDVFGECQKEIDEIENDYEGELKNFVNTFKAVLQKLTPIFNDSFETEGIEKKLNLLDKGDKSLQIAVINDVTTQVMEFISDNGEKSFKDISK